ncbi:hypothetical protein C4K68_07725 [Pokkaliibacter plantistimulans]|uniref:Uncharacterized protein n=1 Tax=Proteobacteria bacterium 228 TaxID=2083153 RepID=A0A2S5KUJ7_9PROT|nr:hypothetical protein [Pokkaliibacter plantistimulans]PPC77926.1 hypothetical protein C4K68_07725 [Pokkaliibacter plantistimulans]
MIKISVTLTGLDKVKKQLREFERKLPTVAAMAATMTAKDVKLELFGKMRTTFDRPTPYTLNSLYVEPATRSTMEARVRFKDHTYKANLPATYDSQGNLQGGWVAPQILGGGRQLKRSERRMRDRGIMRPNQFAVPGGGIKLDKYGNVSRAQMIQVLSRVQAFDGVGFDANTTARSLKRNKNARPYFVASPHDRRSKHLAPGIYERVGQWRVRPILLFVKSPHYRKRFMFYEVGNAVAASEFPLNFEKALKQARLWD